MAKKLPYKPLVYSPKIIVAWGEAISGNTKIRDWLGKNGYPELYTFVFALHLKQDARDWLMKNQYPHLLALIEAVEGKKKALTWLVNHKFSILWYMALAGDGDREATKWLIKNEKEFAMVALKIKIVKDEIETNNMDPHKISGE